VIDGTESVFNVGIRKQPMKGAVEERVNSGVALYMKATWLITIIKIY